MNYKSCLSFLLVLCLSSASSISQSKRLDKLVPEIFNRAVTPQGTCYPPDVIGKFLCPLLPSILRIMGPLPIVELQGFVPDIGEFLSQNLSLPTLGSMVSGPVVIDQATLNNLNETRINGCGISNGSLESELRAEVTLGFNPVLEIVYELDIIVGSIIPIMGKGVITLSLDLDLGLDATVKYCPLDEAMGLTAFEYNAVLPATPVLKIDGLLEGSVIGEALVELMNVQIFPNLINRFTTIDEFIHQCVANFVLRQGNAILQRIVPCDNGLIGTMLGDCSA